MSSANSLISIELPTSLPASSEKATDKNDCVDGSTSNETTRRPSEVKLPISPSMICRTCPGQATPAVSDHTNSSSSDSGITCVSSSYSSLIRFIDSSMFNVYHCIYYLYRRSNSATWGYLAKRLLTYRTEEVDYYLPQLIVLFLRCEEGTRCLLPYLANRVNSSLRFAAQFAWQLDTHQTSHSSTASPSHAFKSLPSIDSDTSVSTTLVAATASTAAGTEKASERAVEDGQEAREEDVDSSSGSLNSLEDSREEEVAVDNGQAERPETEIPRTTSVQQPQQQRKQPVLARAHDSLSKHKRASSDWTSVLNGAAAQCILQTPSGLNSNATNSENEEEEHKGDSQGDAKTAGSVRSESWVKMHSRFYGPTASRSDTHLHMRRARLTPSAPTLPDMGFSTDLLCLPANQIKQLERLQEILSDFLDASVNLPITRTFQADKMVNICRVEWDFVNALMCISRRLTVFSSKEQRTGHLQAELNKLNMALPARVWLPVVPRSHVVLRIPPSAAVCLNSAEKAPYLVYVEILTCDDEASVHLPKGRSFLNNYQRYGCMGSSCSHPSNPNFQQLSFHDSGGVSATTNSSPQLTPSPSRLSMSAANAIAAPELSSQVSTDSVSDSQSAAAAAAAAAVAAASPPPPGSEPEGVTYARPPASKTTEQEEAPVVRFVNAKEVRRRLEQNAACQPQRSFKLDPEDPSAAVLKEPWEAKERRLRESSPWGHLAGWQLAAAIVKVGDDLRQELLAHQLLRRLQRIWCEGHVELWLCPLNVVVTAPDSGMIELVRDTVSLHQIRRHAKLSLLKYVIREHGAPNSEGFLSAQKNFVQSCAAYCLVGYLFQVKDRHNGNILIDKEGHVIHIDYGFMLSSSPGRNLGFEMSPFKLTAEQVELMGGVDSDMFTYYKTLILRGLMVARKHMDELILLVEITRSGYPHLPCFASGGGTRVIEALRQRFMLSSTDEQLSRFVDHMIRQSLNSFTTRLYDNYQYYANGIQ